MHFCNFKVLQQDILQDQNQDVQQTNVSINYRLFPDSDNSFCNLLDLHGQQRRPSVTDACNVPESDTEDATSDKLELSTTVVAESDYEHSLQLGAEDFSTSGGFLHDSYYEHDRDLQPLEQLQQSEPAPRYNGISFVCHVNLVENFTQVNCHCWDSIHGPIMSFIGLSLTLCDGTDTSHML